MMPQQPRQYTWEVEVGGWAVRAVSILGRAGHVPSLSAQIWILAALDQQAEGDRREGEPFAQQCASKSRGHFYPVVSPSAPATQNECELWHPLSL